MHLWKFLSGLSKAIDSQIILCYNNVIILQEGGISMRFCDHIRSIRQKYFLSQETFAKELGVSFATVNRWESGKTKPTYRTMKLIDDFCKKSGIEFDVRHELEGK